MKKLSMIVAVVFIVPRCNAKGSPIRIVEMGIPQMMIAAILNPLLPLRMPAPNQKSTSIMMNGLKPRAIPPKVTSEGTSKPYRRR